MIKKKKGLQKVVHFGKACENYGLVLIGGGRVQGQSGEEKDGEDKQWVYFKKTEEER